MILCTALLVRRPSAPGGRRVHCSAQSAVAGKKALSYDAYDAWWSIQGTTLSRDGEWLAYALTSQGLDGQLVVRNLRTGQELKHPRGTNPAFTPDGKVVTFTIAQTKAEVEKERLSGRGRGGRGCGRQGSRGSRGSRRRECGPAHVGRHHDARYWSGHDRRARRRRQPAGGVVVVGGDAPRPRGWRRARRPRWTGAGRGGRAACGGQRRRRPRAQPEVQADEHLARQAQGQRQRLDRPQSRHRAGDDDSARQRLRVVEGWIMARVRASRRRKPKRTARSRAR